MITADGGGIEPFLPAIECGFIDAVDISNWANPFATFQYLSAGWWPVDANVVNSPVKPGFKDYRLCLHCNRDCGATTLVAVPKCQACGKDIPPGVALKPVREAINGMEDVGAYGFEGLTSWGDKCQQLQADKLAMGDPGASAGSQDSGKGGSSLRFQDGLDPAGKPVMVAGNAQPHYGASVDYLNRFVRNSDMLPGWKIWTALERIGKEENTNKLIVGPSVPGRAGVDKVIGWFNSVLHLELIEGTKRPDGTVPVERKVYLNTHFAPDAPGVPFRAKLSVPFVEGVPTTCPADFPSFIKVLEDARAKAKAKLQKELGIE